MFSTPNFLLKNIFAFFVCFVLIFTACTPIASDSGGSPSSTGGSTGGGTPQTVTLTFDLDGGNIDGKTENVTLTGTSGTSLATPHPVKDGYDLSGWNPAAPAKFPASNTTYKAQWTERRPDEISLTLDLHGGTGIEPFIKGEENSTVTPPQNPTRHGYDFQKWEPELPATFTKQASTKEYVAVWKAKSVTYTLYNKDRASVYKTLTGDHDTNVTRPDAPAPDLTNRLFFDKWEPELPEKFDVDKPTEYEAKYKFVPNENVVLTLKLEGGTLPAGQDEHPHGRQGDPLPSVQNPTKTGYEFKGWNTVDGRLPETFPASDATYTAQWQAKTYAVKYNSNGGGTAPADTTRTYGQSFTLATSAGMSKTGHDFAGWEKDNAGTAYGSGATITDAALTQVDSDITFWAEWTPHTYNVTYNTNGATSGSPSKTTDTHVYGREYTLAARNDLQKTGYTFKGWTTTSDGSGTLYTAGATTSDEAIKSRTSDITFYAKWEVASYSITYNLDGGTNPTGAKTSYTIADATFSLPQPTKSGYTFAGWFENGSFTGSAVTQITTGSTGSRTFWAKWEVVTMTLDQAIAAIKALPSGQTLDIDLGSDTTQAVFDSKNEALKTALKNCKGKVNFDMSKSSMTSIGYYAFGDCTSLASVNIPDGVTSIGQAAFYGCTSLASVNIPDGVTSIEYYAFMDCTSLASVSIPDSVTSIGDGAFHDCKSLANVVIPDSVTSIGYLAFAGCTSLASVNIPDGVTRIGDSAFISCTSLASVVIPNSVTSIGESAFGFTSLTNVVIPDGVTSIGHAAFSQCKSLTSVVIGEGVTSTGDHVFSYCTSLASVVIGEGVTRIGYSAFEGCTSLSSVDIPDGVTNIGQYAFSGCTSLANVDIPSGVTSIGNSAFSGCTSLANVDIPDGVISIGYSPFKGCPITTINIPSSITRIGDSAFRDCKSLTSVVIPDSITRIGDYAFSGCISLATINYAGTKNDWNTKITYFGDIWGWKENVPAKGVTCNDGVTYKFLWSSKLGDPL